MGLLVYFSSKSQNTHRFVQKLGFESARIPYSSKQDLPKVREPYVLVLPTYADNEGRGAVPKPVIRFLNDPENRSYIRGVIASGNRNFGEYYAYAGKVIASRCKVPFLYRYELMGTQEDVIKVKQGLNALWTQ